MLFSMMEDDVIGWRVECKRALVGVLAADNIVGQITYMFRPYFIRIDRFGLVGLVVDRSVLLSIFNNHFKRNNQKPFIVKGECGVTYLDP